MKKFWLRRAAPCAGFAAALGSLALGIAMTAKNWENRGNSLIFLISGALIGAGAVLAMTLILYTFGKNKREIRQLRQKKEMAELLHRQQETIAHHQRMETIGTLTASIAHEFNNLLTPIMGYSMMTLEKLPPEEEELYDNILEIYNASRKAKGIISRLSDLSRKNTAETFRDLSPDDLVKKTLNVAAPAKPENVEMQLSLNCWGQQIHANEIQLSQLLLNLMLNSFNAMEKTGGILAIQTAFDEENLILTLSDTGCGIPEDVLPRIFDPFFTTKEPGKGTGLGLAIAAQVVEDHGGTIHADSVPGRGTMFTVTLPREAKPDSPGK